MRMTQVTADERRRAAFLNSKWKLVHRLPDRICRHSIPHSQAFLLCPSSERLLKLVKQPQEAGRNNSSVHIIYCSCSARAATIQTHHRNAPDPQYLRQCVSTEILDSEHTIHGCAHRIRKHIQVSLPWHTIGDHVAVDFSSATWLPGAKWMEAFSPPLAPWPNAIYSTRRASRWPDRELPPIGAAPVPLPLPPCPRPVRPWPRRRPVPPDGCVSRSRAYPSELVRYVRERVVSMTYS